MPKKRILFIHNFYQNPGGEDVVFAAESNLLLNHGHEVSVLTDTNDNVLKMGKFAAARNAIWSSASARRVEELITIKRPDIVHVHNTWMMLSPSIYSICQKLNVPVVQTLHNYRLLCPNAYLFRDNKVCEDCIPFSIPWPGIYHKCYRGSLIQTSIVAAMLSYHRLMRTWQEQINCYIVLSEFARQKFIQGGFPRQKIMVKPNFVSPPPSFTKTEPDYALFVGRLSVEKGVDVLLSAWELLPGIPLKILGDGPLGEKTRSFAASHENVSCFGQVEREIVYKLMVNARFLIFPSVWYEGFPMSIVEAFSLGVPVVSSALGGMQEIVHDKHLGILFNPGDAKDLATRVRWLWSHPEESERMGQNARREYEQKYTPERNYQLLLDIYQRAMNFR